ncbi:MAG: glycosyltransferase family 39 protein [Bacteroidota bacterium]
MSISKSLLVVGIISYVLISANIGGYSIYMLDEAKNTQCAREMADRGDWIVPTFNGQLRTDKPPLHYFFMRLSYSVFGDGAFGARFFSSIFGVLTVLLTYFFTRSFLGEKAASYSALVLLCSLGFIAQFHLAVPDPYLIFFITAAICCYFYYEQKQKRKYLYLAYIAVGLGVLTKGPIAIVLPGMAVFFFMIYKRKLTARELLMLNPPLGLLIIAAIAGPWYYLVHIETAGAWTQGFFLDHNVNRFNAPKEGHSGGFWLPTAYALGMLLPFSVFIPQAVRQAFKEKQDILVYSLITIGCMLLFFSLASTKLPGYTSPVFPFAAIVLGNYLSKIEQYNRKWILTSLVVFLVITIGLFVGSKIGIQDAKEIRHLTHLQWYFLPVPIIAFVALIFLLLGKRQLSMLSTGVSFLVLHQLFFYFVFPEINQQNTVVKTIDWVKDEPNLIAYHRLNSGYVHALDRVIPMAYKSEEITDFFEEKGSGVIFTRPEYMEELTSISFKEVARAPDLFDGTTTVLLRVGQN